MSCSLAIRDDFLSQNKKPAQGGLFVCESIANFNMVPKTGLEPARLAPLPPQGSVSTNFTTWAKTVLLLICAR
jgi:hypothetical protein